MGARIICHCCHSSGYRDATHLSRLSRLCSGFRARARRSRTGAQPWPRALPGHHGPWPGDHGTSTHRGLRARLASLASPRQNRHIPPVPVPARWRGRPAEFNGCDILLILFNRVLHPWNRGEPGDGAGGERGTGGDAVASAGRGPARSGWRRRGDWPGTARTGLGPRGTGLGQRATGLGPRGLAWDQSCDGLESEGFLTRGDVIVSRGRPRRVPAANQRVNFRRVLLFYELTVNRVVVHGECRRGCVGKRESM